MNGGKTPHGGARISEDYKTVNLGAKEDFQRLEYQGLYSVVESDNPKNRQQHMVLDVERAHCRSL